MPVVGRNTLACEPAPISQGPSFYLTCAIGRVIPVQKSRSLGFLFWLGTWVARVDSKKFAVCLFPFEGAGRQHLLRGVPHEGTLVLSPRCGGRQACAHRICTVRTCVAQANSICVLVDASLREHVIQNTLLE